jgi:hypothetical protein
MRPRGSPGGVSRTGRREEVGHVMCWVGGEMEENLPPRVMSRKTLQDWSVYVVKH